MNRWIESLKVYADRRMLALLTLGFSSGLPLLLRYSTLAFWLHDEGLSIKAIGLFTATSLPFTLKPFWAPIIDRLPLPILTRLLGLRRSWMLLTQLGIAACVIGLALSDPGQDPVGTALWAIGVAFCSASQDIVIDAYRVEILEVDEQGAGAGVAVFGYRIGMLVASAGVLYLVAFSESWTLAYLVMAAFTLVGIVTTLLIKEPENTKARMLRYAGSGSGEQSHTNTPSVFTRILDEFVEGVVGPLKDFFGRKGWYLFLLFVLLYKLGDAMAGVMTNPLLADLGFEKIDIANVGKTYGLVASIAGVLIGGWMVRGTGVVKALWIAGFLQMFSNLMFTLQAVVGADLWMLTATIGVENLTGGIGTAAFVAYLSGLCNKSYSATQYALLTALAGSLRSLFSLASGYLVEELGGVGYFVATTFAAIPGLIVLFLLLRFNMTGLDGGSGGGGGDDKKGGEPGAGRDGAVESVLMG